MSTLTFRNSAGNLIDLPSVPATRFKNAWSEVLEAAIRGGAIAITKHQTPKAVLLSYEEFSALSGASRNSLDSLGGEFDGLLEKLQTSAAKKGLAKAFDATPEFIGIAAVKEAVPRVIDIGLVAMEMAATRDSRREELRAALGAAADGKVTLTSHIPTAKKARGFRVKNPSRKGTSFIAPLQPPRANAPPSGMPGTSGAKQRKTAVA